MWHITTMIDSLLKIISKQGMNNKIPQPQMACLFRTLSFCWSPEIS